MDYRMHALEQPIGDIDYWAILFSFLLFLPFLVWGIITLRIRFSHHHELHPLVEAATLFAVGIFFTLEVDYVERMFGRDTGLYVMSLVGLGIAGLALYGHLAVSLMSHLVVSSLIPARHEGIHTPTYGAAEAFEQVGDYEAAVREYTFLARTFPRDHKTQVRMADNLIKLERAEEAAPWLEKAMNTAPDDEACLLVLNRLFDVYFRKLDRIDDAERILEDFLERFPDSQYCSTVSRRLAKVQAGGMPSSFDFRAPTVAPGVPLEPPVDIDSGPGLELPQPREDSKVQP